jgi:hypothetical protein
MGDYSQGLIGPTLPDYNESGTSGYALSTAISPGWSWSALDLPSGSKQDNDNDSLEAFDGEEDAGGAEYRAMEGFGDDLSAFQTSGGMDSTHHTSPTMLPSTEFDHDDMPDLEQIGMPMIGDHSFDHEEVIPLGVGMMDEDVEGEVAEVRVDDEMVEHVKKD